MVSLKRFGVGRVASVPAPFRQPGMVGPHLSNRVSRAGATRNWSASSSCPALATDRGVSGGRRYWPRYQPCMHVIPTPTRRSSQRVLARSVRHRSLTRKRARRAAHTAAKRCRGSGAEGGITRLRAVWCGHGARSLNGTGVQRVTHSSGPEERKEGSTRQDSVAPRRLH